MFYVKDLGMLLGVLIPMLIGYVSIVNWLVEKYLNWLWIGMKEEKRFFYIKVARW